LPDPVVTDPAASFAEDLSYVLLLTLERLSPLERAAFLLHDVFDMDYADVAGLRQSQRRERSEGLSPATMATTWPLPAVADGVA
jgi:DNA-directed RNA polymerase specialized sigma24 family protein